MRITGRSTLFLLAAAALLSLATPADAYRLDETWERSFDVDEGAQFGLENVNGAISVEGWDRDEIQVSARIRIKAPSKDRAKKIFRMIEFDVEADRS
ncbi:MAG TPA: hypothetical protein VLA34_13605, partial [Candidatus Krumholzibacterium sp.]|nr:hypothetical protein [Candidatus Krumholzibacterium sp.]